MNTPRLLLSLGLVSMMSAAAAQTYGPEDEGRRFNDGSKIVCKNVEVQKNSKDPNRVAGTAIGAVVGGLLGSGSGKKVATVGGAVAGGAIGRKVQGNSQEDKGDRIVERRCERVYR